MKDKELFFLVRGKKGGSPLRKDPSYFKYPDSMASEGYIKKVPADVWDDLVRDRDTMLAFIEEALPFMGLDTTDTENLSTELLQQLTVTIRQYRKDNAKNDKN